MGFVGASGKDMVGALCTKHDCAAMGFIGYISALQARIWWARRARRWTQT